MAKGNLADLAQHGRASSDETSTTYGWTVEEAEVAARDHRISHFLRQAVGANGHDVGSRGGLATVAW